MTHYVDLVTLKTMPVIIALPPQGSKMLCNKHLGSSREAETLVQALQLSIKVIQGSVLYTRQVDRKS